MKKLETEIVINSTPQQIWDILMNHEAYPNWNPFIKTITGDPQVGNVIDVTIQPKDKSPMNFNPLVLKNERLDEFRWKGHLFVKGLFDGEHYFKLEPIDESQTRFVHGELFSGLLASVLLKMIGENTRDSFASMNEALKNEVEN